MKLFKVVLQKTAIVIDACNDLGHEAGGFDFVDFRNQRLKTDSKFVIDRVFFIRVGGCNDTRCNGDNFCAFGCQGLCRSNRRKLFFRDGRKSITEFVEGYSADNSGNNRHQSNQSK